MMQHLGGRASGAEYSHFSKRAFPLKTIKEEDQVVGIISVDNELFVVSKESKRVKVYDALTLIAKGQINIPDMKGPEGITGCSKTETLFICDTQRFGIHKVNLRDGTQGFLKLDVRYVACGLSISTEYNLLVTMAVRRTGYEGKILELTTEGDVVREIKLDASIRWPWNTVQLSHDRFATCHGMDYSSIHRVCIVNPEGQIIRSYGRDLGPCKDQFHWPFTLDVDRSREVIFVADFSNHRIVMLGFDLNLLGQLETREKFAHPSRFLYDTRDERLFVVERYAGKLSIINTATLKRASKNTGNDMVIGVTGVDDRLYVAWAGQSLIRVHDKSNLAPLPSMNVCGLSCPQGLEGCSKTKALYISDTTVKSILKVSVLDGLVSRWELKDNYVPFGLFLTSEGNLLVTCRVGGGRSDGRIIEYTTEGLLVREIKLDPSLDNAWQAIQLSKKRFIICLAMDYGCLYALRVVDSNGKRIETKRDTKYDNITFALAVDYPERLLYVLDFDMWGLPMIDMINSNLHIRDSFIRPAQVEYPTRMYYESSTDKLYFVQHYTGEVSVGFLGGYLNNLDRTDSSEEITDEDESISSDDDPDDDDDDDDDDGLDDDDLDNDDLDDDDLDYDDDLDDNDLDDDDDLDDDLDDDDLDYDDDDLDDDNDLGGDLDSNANSELL